MKHLTFAVAAVVPFKTKSSTPCRQELHLRQNFIYEYAEGEQIDAAAAYETAHHNLKYWVRSSAQRFLNLEKCVIQEEEITMTLELSNTEKPE